MMDDASAVCVEALRHASNTLAMNGPRSLGTAYALSHDRDSYSGLAAGLKVGGILLTERSELELLGQQLRVALHCLTRNAAVAQVEVALETLQGILHEPNMEVGA